jgi:hypothetical protein
MASRRAVNERSAEEIEADEIYFRDMRRALDEVRPAHTKKFGRFTREWAMACQLAFAKAMRESGEYARDAVLPPAKSTALGRSRASLQGASVNAP